jgi:hypothetical protein
MGKWWFLDSRVVEHARYCWLLVAEGHLTWRLFGSMVRRIESLPLPGGRNPKWKFQPRRSPGRELDGLIKEPWENAVTLAFRSASEVQ